MTKHSDFVSKEWLRDKVITMQEGGRFARRSAHIEVADALLPVLRRMAIYQLRNSWLVAYGWQQAEDAASYAYMRFLQKLGTFVEPYDIIAWFHAVIRNFFRDEAHNYGRVFCTDEQFLFECATYDRTGALSIARIVRQAVQQLTPTQQEAIILRYWHELTSTAIAQRCGVKHQAISFRLERAHNQLRRILLEGGLTAEGWADADTT